MGIGDRLARAEGRLGPELCEARPCHVLTTTELIVHADDTEERVGHWPPPLCATCPERDNPRRPIRHIVLVRGLGDQQEQPRYADSAATLADGGKGRRW
jgi:hypothetical protein